MRLLLLASVPLLGMSASCGGSSTPDDQYELCNSAARIVCGRDDCGDTTDTCVDDYVDACCSGVRCDYLINAFNSEVNDCLDIYRNASCTELETGTVDASFCDALINLTYSEYCAEVAAWDCDNCVPGDSSCFDTTWSNCCATFEADGYFCDEFSPWSQLDTYDCLFALEQDACQSANYPLACF